MDYVVHPKHGPPSLLEVSSVQAGQVHPGPGSSYRLLLSVVQGMSVHTWITTRVQLVFYTCHLRSR